jgi:Ca2+-binding RTX toxin-like protein
MAAINGSSGNDSLTGTSGNDTISGFGGNDLILAGSTGGADVIDGGTGSDSIEFKERATNGVVVDFVAGTISGGSSGTISFTNIERVVGGNFNDRLSGSAAGQTLTGQAGADTLWGAGGIDTLWGGSGADRFLFRETGTGNADLVRDWASGSDKLLLDGAVMSALGAAGNFAAGDARFKANSTGTATDASDRVMYNASNGQVWYDADGNGAGARQLIATLQSGATLVATDIVVEDGSSGQTINGTPGNDSLVGGDGNDTISGFGGNDTLDGGAGIDNLNGGLGNDTYIVSEEDDVVSDSGGIDTVITGVDFGVENSQFWGLGEGFENLTMTGSNSVSGFGNDLPNVMRSEAFQVEFAGRGGNDTIFGGGVGDGGPTDLLDGDDGDDEIHGAGGPDIVRGFWGNDLLFGDDGNDFIQGFQGNDTMFGGAGNDVFYMYASDNVDEGQDTIDGGAGLDSVEFDGNLASSGVVIDLANGTATGGGASGSGIVTLVNIENVVGTTRFADRITGDAGANALAGIASGVSGAEANDTLDGAAGIDTLTGGAGATSFIFSAAPGTANADQITDFTSGADKIRLDGRVMTNLGASGDFAADDARFFAAAGANGGHDADDRVVYNTTTRQLFYDADGSGAGARQLIATLQSGATLVATDIAVEGGSTGGGQTIDGTSGNDTLTGTSGNDTINGLGGNDLFLAGSTGGADVINGGAGSDSIEFKERATSGVVVDFAAGTITGGSSGTISFTGIERAVTGNFNDSLTGNAAGQTLTGQGGADTLWGAGGIDTLWGGAGADRFIFRETGSANADLVRDWAAGSDKVALDNSPMSALGATGNFASGDARFKANSTGTATDTNDRVVYNTSTGSLYYDADGSGSGAAQLIATFSGNPAVAATDIVVI